MSGVKISNLPAVAAPALTDIFPIVQAGTTFKETVTQLKTLLLANGFANDGANTDITSMTGLTGAIQAPTAITSSAALNLLTFTYTATAVNYITATNNATGLNPIIGATGSDTNVALQLTGKGTQGVILEGTSTNDSAAAGMVGEYISTSVLTAGAVAVLTGADTTIASITLTPGDWNCQGFIVTKPAAGTTTSDTIVGISQTTNVMPTIAAENNYNKNGAALLANIINALNVGSMRISLSAASTPIYLVANVSFAVSTMAVYGFIGARRVR